MINIKRPIPKDLPILTDVVGGTPVELPTLTDIAEETTPAATPHLSELEAHLTSLFEQKLQQRFAAAQQQAIQQALAEFKKELPHLIHDALNTPPSR